MMSVGTKHNYFWDFKAGDKQKRRGIAGQFGVQSHQVCCYDTEGIAYSGCADGRIFVWKDRIADEATKKAHNGVISAIRCIGDKIFSGGKDCKVMSWSTGTLEAGIVLNFEAMVRAIDFKDDRMLVGLRNGTIYELSKFDDEGSKRAVMQSHDNGEVWGLAASGDEVLTCGDDNKVMHWDFANRTCTKTDIVSTESNRSRKGRASTLSRLPAS